MKTAKEVSEKIIAHTKAIEDSEKNIVDLEAKKDAAYRKVQDFTKADNLTTATAMKYMTELYSQICGERTAIKRANTAIKKLQEELTIG